MPRATSREKINLKRFREVLQMSPPTAEAVGRAFIADYCATISGEPLFSQDEYNFLVNKAVLCPDVIKKRQIGFLRAIPGVTDKVKYFAAMEIAQAKSQVLEVAVHYAKTKRLRQVDWEELKDAGEALLDANNVIRFTRAISDSVRIPEIYAISAAQVNSTAFSEADITAYFFSADDDLKKTVAKITFRPMPSEALERKARAEKAAKKALDNRFKRLSSTEWVGVRHEAQIWAEMCDYRDACLKIDAETVGFDAAPELSVGKRR